MNSTDLQFKAFLRLSLRLLGDAMEAKTEEEKNEILQRLIEDYQKTLED